MKVLMQGTLRPPSATGGEQSDFTLYDDRLGVLATAPSPFPGRIEHLVTSSAGEENGTVCYGGSVPAPGTGGGSAVLLHVVTVSATSGDTAGFSGTDTFFWPGMALASLHTLPPCCGQSQSSPGFAALVQDTASSAWEVRFLRRQEVRANASTGNATSPTYHWAFTWSLTASPQTLLTRAPVMSISSHLYNCSLAPGQGRFAGDVYADSCTGTVPLVVLSDGAHVSIQAVTNSSDALVDIAAPGASLFFSACAEGTSCGRTVRHVQLFRQRVPFNVTAQALLPNATRTQIPAPTMWMVVGGSQTVGGASSPMADLIKLPEFAPPLTERTAYSPPSSLNPSGAPPAVVACLPHSTFNWTLQNCSARGVTDLTQAAGGDPALRGHSVTSVAVRWRGLLAEQATLLDSSGCDLLDTACLQAAAGGTGQLPGGLPGGLQQSPSNNARRLQSTQPGLPSNASDAGAVLDHIYGLRHAIFLTVDDSALAVLQAQQFEPACTQSSAPGLVGEAGLVVRQAVNVLFMGKAMSMHVTPNGQYALASVTRRRFELRAMERLARTCTALSANRSDPFLSPWTDTCGLGSTKPPPELIPRFPSVVDFVQIATACLPGLHCPSFEREEVAQLPSGKFTRYSFDVQDCDEGHFCISGSRAACPIGFTCPGTGTVRPQRCDESPTGDATCFEQGLTQPQPCTNGTMCTVTYMPPLPVPPGYVQAEAADGRRVLEPCEPGQWCSLGRAEGEGPDALSCPAFTHCEDPEVLVPSVCTSNGTCTTTSCASGAVPYCPAGSVREVRCPAGAYCSRPDTKQECSAGSWCPEGSGVWKVCPAGWFCPTPAERRPCPRGSYCPQGSISPSVCQNVFASCSCAGPDGAGCSSPTDFSGLAAVVVLAATTLVLVSLAGFVQRRRQAAADAQRASARALNALPKVRRRATTAAGPHAADIELSPLPGSPGPRGHSVTQNPLRDGTATGAGDGSSDGTTSDRSSPLAERLSRSGTVFSPVLDWAGSLAGSSAVGGSPLPHSAPMRGTRSKLALQRRASGIVMDPRTFVVDISFQNLGLRLGGPKGRPLLEGVTGSVLHGRVCAVMGPSGAGKSTLLTTLAGKAHYGHVTGSIFINGAPGSVTSLAGRVGFVPQEDTMLRDQTVEETLRFAAMARLPAAWTHERKLLQVDRVLHLLELQDCRHSLIGDEAQRGISGGQRKRVNIGMEIVGEPCVLFLDEPTSGLDATSSLHVCSALRRIARLGITVVLVVHQPRYEILAQCHDLILLGKGGRTVYAGPTPRALPYFESLGLRPPAHANPADFMLDVIGGRLPPDFAAEHPTWTPQELLDAWSAHVAAEAVEAAASTQGSLAALVTVSGSAHTPGAAGKTEDRPIPGSSPRCLRVEDIPPRIAAGFPVLLVLTFQRAVSQIPRHWVVVISDVLLCILAAVFLAAVYNTLDLYAAPVPIEYFAGCHEDIARSCQLVLNQAQDQVLNRGIMVLTAVAQTAAASMVRVFGDERQQYFREAAALPQPAHTLAYFCAKDMAMLPSMALAPFMYTVVFVSSTNPRMSFWGYYGVLFLVYYFASGMAYLVSVLLPASTAQLAGVILVFGASQFAGCFPTLPVLAGAVPPISWLSHISFARYALEALYVGEIAKYAPVVELQGVDLQAHLASAFNYSLDSYYPNVLILLGMGVLVRIFAAVAMWRKDSAQKV